LLDRKKESKIPTEIKYIIIIVIIGIAIFWLGFRFAFGVYNPFYMVASESMVPVLNVGDFIIIQHNFPFDSLKVGDIIVFKTPGVTTEGEHKVIVHRIAQIIIITDDDNANNNNNNNNRIIIRTKGDANSHSIPLLDYPIREGDYIGKVVYIIPKVGLITKAISPPVNYIMIGLILIFLFFYLKKRK
jgi:signal peptidase I